MFSKRDHSNYQARACRSGDRGMPSIISKDLHVVGDLKTDGEIQIDGIVEGDVFGHALTIGNGAKVIGEVVADDIVIRGSVFGPVRGRRIEIAATAKVVGELWHEMLSMATGAQIDCKIRCGEGWRAERGNKVGRSRGPEPDEGDGVPVMRWHRQQNTARPAP